MLVGGMVMAQSLYSLSSESPCFSACRQPGRRRRSVCSGINYTGECTKVTGAFNANGNWNARTSGAANIRGVGKGIVKNCCPRMMTTLVAVSGDRPDHCSRG